MNDAITVTTGDLKRDYEIIGPVYFQVSNKGVFSSALSKLAKQYSKEIADAKKHGQVGASRADWGFCMESSVLGKATSKKHSSLPFKNSRSVPPLWGQTRLSVCVKTLT